jgi:hypothetical protein
MYERVEIAGMTRLVFVGVEEFSLAEIGQLLVDVDETYWLAAEVYDPNARKQPELLTSVERIEFHSLEVVLELPSIAWTVGFGYLFVNLLAMIFKLPALYQQARSNFYNTRAAADLAKREWIRGARPTTTSVPSGSTRSICLRTSNDAQTLRRSRRRLELVAVRADEHFDVLRVDVERRRVRRERLIAVRTLRRVHGARG